jgi:hypothetical protein
MRVRHWLVGCLAVVVSMTLPGTAQAASLPSLTEVRGALLRGSDLPGDYTRDHSESTSTTAHSSAPRCSATVSDGALYSPIRESFTHATRSFTAGRLGPWVGSGVAVWRAKVGAADYMQYLRRALRNCDAWSEVDNDGIRYRIRLAPLAFPQLAADTVALGYTVIQRGTVDIIGHADVTVMRVRNAVTIVTQSRTGTGATVDHEALARLSVTRLRTIM